MNVTPGRWMCSTSADGMYFVTGWPPSTTTSRVPNQDSGSVIDAASTFRNGRPTMSASSIPASVLPDPDGPKKMMLAGGAPWFRVASVTDRQSCASSSSRT
jgi:hypothetical protein